MAKSRTDATRTTARAALAAGLVAGCLVLAAGTARAAAAPTVAQMLALRPKQENVAYTTPAPADQEGCRVEPAEQAAGRGGGWILKDATGKLLRRFVDTNADGKIDTYSYFLDGTETYREIDSHFAGKVDQYRWFNAGGTRWGFDYNGDHVIDAWKVISAEEVSQEVLQALLARNFDRLHALWISKEELKQLAVSAAEETRLTDLHNQARAKFDATAAKLTQLGKQTRWVRLETTGPQCVPAQQFGGQNDVIRHSQSLIVCDTAGKNDLVQVGEMIQVGLAWRLVDAPSPGDAPTQPDAKTVTDPVVQKLLDDLRELDKRSPKAEPAPGPNPAVVKYNTERVALLDQIIAKVTKPEDRDQWYRQLADSLSAGAQASPREDRSMYTRLLGLEQQLAKDFPGSSLAGYVTFREMQAEYAARLAAPAGAGGADFTKVQEQWIERLTQFVQAYPRADDSPDALLQLGMVSEFIGKEPEAKKWYQQLAKTFPERKALSEKARGALARLDLEGKTLELSGPTLPADGGSPGTADVAKLRGKTVVVYYWASWNQQCLGDFAKLKLLLDAYAAKGLELICVNLDTTADEALAFLKKSPAPGTHLHQPGGLDSPLATQYGVVVLPNMFLVGPDGKVANRTVQMSTLEEEIKKLVK